MAAPAVLRHRPRPGQVRGVRRVAASHGGTLGNWSPYRVSPHQEPLDRETMQTRSEDIVANDGHATSVRDTIIINAIGTGLTPQSAIDHEALGITEDQARGIEKAQERAFRLWQREAHVGRAMHFQDCQQLSVGCVVTFGEYAWVGRMLDEATRLRKGRRFSFALQDIHPIRLKTPTDRALDPQVRDGILLDEDGEAQGYWFTNSDSMGALTEYQFVPARQGHRQLVFHACRHREPEQVRGIPLLAPVIKLFRDKYDFLDYEIIAQIITASFPIAIESENPKDHGVPQGTGGAGAGTDKRWYQGVNPGQILYPNPGERVNAIQSNRPGNNFDSFFKLILKTLGAVAGIPYNQILKDFSDTNYSSARAALLEAWRVYQDYRAWLVRQFCQPVREHVLEEAWLRGMWSIPEGAPGFYQHMDLYTACRWTPPPRGYVDPYKEIQSQVRGLESGLYTWSDLLAEQGMDWEEAFQQQAREHRLRESLDLPLPGAGDSHETDPLAMMPDPPAIPGT